MATQISAPTTPLSRPAPRIGGFQASILAIVALVAIGAVAWAQADSTRDAAPEAQAYGFGYPLHGGLAGPSRVSAEAMTAGPSRPYGAGYPLHGGLAGPSRAASAAGSDAHHGAGYPLHGGLAGPSRAADGE